MAYATTAQLKQRLGSNVSDTDPGDYQMLTDRLGGTTADDDVAGAAITWADARINSKLVKAGYAVPVSTDNAEVSAMLNGLSLDLAVFHLWDTYPGQKEVPARVQNAYDDAVGLLDDIVDGKAALPSDTVLESTNANGISVSSGGWTPTMTEDGLNGIL